MPNIPSPSPASRRSDLVRPTRRDKGPAGPLWLRHFWQRVRAQADLSDVRLHDLCHNPASYAVMNGVPMPVVSRLLGHRNVRMKTLRYTHLANKDIEAAAEGVGAAMARAMALVQRAGGSTYAEAIHAMNGFQCRSSRVRSSSDFFCMIPFDYRFLPR